MDLSVVSELDVAPFFQIVDYSFQTLVLFQFLLHVLVTSRNLLTLLQLLNLGLHVVELADILLDLSFLQLVFQLLLHDLPLGSSAFCACLHQIV